MSKDRNIFPARTNQKLYFARLQLGLVHEALADTSAFDSEPRAMSCREAGIWHLHAGLGAFMQELSRFYKVIPPVSTPAALAAAMAQRQQVSPEAEILQQLSDLPDSWLSQLNQLYRATLLPVELPDLATEAESPARIGIAVVNTSVDSPLSQSDLATLDAIHRALTQAIRDFRAELVEF